MYFFRVSFITGLSDPSSPGSGGDQSYLQVKDVRPGDKGVYRCRVDFKHAQTRNSSYNILITFVDFLCGISSYHSKSFSIWEVGIPSHKALFILGLMNPVLLVGFNVYFVHSCTK
jgi:hypothetical protein